MSYYVRYMTSKGKETTIWAKDLERVIDENNIKAGEYCRFAITNERQCTITITDKKNPSKRYTKIVYAKVWDASIEGRDEKDLKPLKSFYRARYETSESKTNEYELNKYEQSKDNANINEYTSINIDEYSKSSYESNTDANIPSYNKEANDLSQINSFERINKKNINANKDEKYASKSKRYQKVS